ncbi:ABC transporter ATP-binding protein [Flexilinea flocculi]|uniref:Oligopeptide/dipeptide ABC transporter, ATP-binding protein, C-terminal domain n=1 Tax=Flexilinea flocculi TaxID=1678840 RepID=A0A0S7BX45_9CHLR|nr:oligopeptide/dipeptide ABC transporter ATP-binding protein [Flexilinea flocculi]GAP41241.1 oligopeptide/dipeptide ABC transporter, ATP-binding protein, C-terminal domain [Flexilinea flocculi]
MSDITFTQRNIPAERLLEVNHLKKYFPITSGIFKKHIGDVKAVDDLNLYVNEGETLGLVGESGCGKTTASRCILRAYEPTAGEIFFRNKKQEYVDLAHLSDKDLRPMRPEMQMIFQDPFGSLNPRMNIFDIISEPMLVNGIRNRKEREERVVDLLKKVGLRPEYMVRYPHSFSGGQRQRIGIARALALQPRLVVADEPVSALDVSVQAQVLNLLMELMEDMGLTYLFVAHDLSVVRHICDRVTVMYVGKIVETAPTEELYYNPRHPYSEALMAAVPIADPRLQQDRKGLPGEVPSPANPPSGCYFHPRCSYCKDRCKAEVPELREISPNHWTACHRAEELSLEGLKK